MSQWSNGQDSRLSRGRPGFDSRLWRSILAHFCSRWAACAGVLRVCGGVGVLVGPVGWCWGGGWGWCGVGRACVALRLAGWRRSAGFFWRVRVFVVGRFEEFFWRGPFFFFWSGGRRGGGAGVGAGVREFVVSLRLVFFFCVCASQAALFKLLGGRQGRCFVWFERRLRGAGVAAALGCGGGAGAAVVRSCFLCVFFGVFL